MRVTIISLMFVSVLFLGGLAGCKDQASQPAASTNNTVNSSTVQNQSESDNRIVTNGDLERARLKAQGIDPDVYEANQAKVLADRKRETQKW